MLETDANYGFNELPLREKVKILPLILGELWLGYPLDVAVRGNMILIQEGQETDLSDIPEPQNYANPGTEWWNLVRERLKLPLRT